MPTTQDVNKFIEPYVTELHSALDLSIKGGLVPADARISNDRQLLASKNVSSAVDGLINDAWPKNLESDVRLPAPGACLVLAARILPVIKQHFQCNAWVALGWVADATFGKDVWRRPGFDFIAFFQRALELSPHQRLLASMAIQGQYHAWVVVETGEAIDPAVFPTYAALGPRRFRKGEQEYLLLNALGAPYKKHNGLPKLQLHPVMLMDERTIGEFVQFSDRLYPDNTPLP